MRAAPGNPLVQYDPRYGNRGAWARVFWLFPLGPGAALGFTALTISRGDMTSDTLAIAALFFMIMTWMCIGCIWILREGYHTVQRLTTCGETICATPYFGQPVTFRRHEILKVQRHNVPRYRRPFTLLDRGKNDNWCIQLAGGRSIFLNARYFTIETFGVGFRT